MNNYDWKVGLFKGLKAAALAFIGVAASSGLADNTIDAISAGLIPHVSPATVIVIVGLGKVLHNLVKNYPTPAADPTPEDK